MRLDFNGENVKETGTGTASGADDPLAEYRMSRPVQEQNRQQTTVMLDGGTALYLIIQDYRHHGESVKPEFKQPSCLEDAPKETVSTPSPETSAASKSQTATTETTKSPTPGEEPKKATETSRQQIPYAPRETEAKVPPPPGIDARVWERLLRSPFVFH